MTVVVFKDVADDALFIHEGRWAMTDWGIEFAVKCLMSWMGNTGVRYEDLDPARVADQVAKSRQFFLDKGAEVAKFKDEGGTLKGLVFKDFSRREAFLKHLS